MGDLRKGVDAGVRAARSVRLEWPGSERRLNGTVQLALYGPCIILPLPAAVARPAYSIVSLNLGIFSWLELA
jgi:hypothetical protein